MSRHHILTAGARSLVVSSGCSSSAAPSSSSISSTASSSNISAHEKSDSSKTLVVSFSAPAPESSDSTDTDTSASIIVENGTSEGSAHYVADQIAQQMNAETFRLEPVNTYPTRYDELLEIAQSQQSDSIRPELKNIPDLEGPEAFILVTPIWWSDLPAPAVPFWKAKTGRIRE